MTITVIHVLDYEPGCLADWQYEFEELLRDSVDVCTTTFRGHTDTDAHLPHTVLALDCTGYGWLPNRIEGSIESRGWDCWRVDFCATLVQKYADDQGRVIAEWRCA